MAELSNTSDRVELPPLPKAPWATMLTALLFLFFFFGLVVIVLHYSENMSEAPRSGENRLQELRASESETLNSYGYDARTKSYRIPIERAMDHLINEANAKAKKQ